jgi:hypothetical protein
MKQERSEAVLDLLFSEAAEAAASNQARPGVVVGTVTEVDARGDASVALAGAASAAAVPVRSIIALNRSHVGRKVVLAFDGDDPGRPIVMGVLQESGTTEVDTKAKRDLQGVEADLDGETLVLKAKRQIELRCGNSSITLTRAGKVLIKGAYLLSRSSGVHRIKGGSVQIN